MGHAVGSHRFRTMEAIRRVGLRLIYKHGCEGMGLRRPACEVGIQTSSLPTQITAKRELLFELIKRQVDELLHGTDQALKGAEPPDNPSKAVIGFHLGYHPVHKWEVFISSSELRSLDPGNDGAGVALRRAYERKLIGAPGCCVVRAAPTVSGAQPIAKERRIARPSRNKSAITMERTMFHRRICFCGLLVGSFLCQGFWGHLYSIK